MDERADRFEMMAFNKYEEMDRKLNEDSRLQAMHRWFIRWNIVINIILSIHILSVLMEKDDLVLILFCNSSLTIMNSNYLSS